MKTDDGGPAFPVHHCTDEVLGYPSTGFPAKDIAGVQVWVNSGGGGMSKREVYALVAFHALLTVAAQTATKSNNRALNLEVIKAIPASAVAAADDLLAALKERPQ